MVQKSNFHEQHKCAARSLFSSFLWLNSLIPLLVIPKTFRKRLLPANFNKEVMINRLKVFRRVNILSSFVVRLIEPASCRPILSVIILTSSNSAQCRWLVVDIYRSAKQ